MPLDVLLDPPAPSRPRLAIPGPALAGLAGALGAAVAAAWLGGLPWTAVHIVAVPATHGALLTIALAGADPRWPAHAAGLVALLGTAALATAWSAWGALVYLAVPVALIAAAVREPGLGALGLRRPDSWAAALAGLAAGLLLGAHLLFSAPRAFGYEVRFFPLDRYLPALAYDAGANVLSAECFFRGVVFNHAHRRWPFGGAAALATGAFLIRHLVDPALPHAVETIVGATFYLTLLGVTNCALFWRSGSLLPGALAGLGFFAAYRALAGWW